jgi:hypothetical protein
MLLDSLSYRWNGKDFASFSYQFSVESPSKEEISSRLKDDTLRLHNFVDSLIQNYKLDEGSSCENGVFSLRRTYQVKSSIFSDVTLCPSFSVRNQSAGIFFQSSFTILPLNLQMYDLINSCKEIISDDLLQRVHREIKVLREGISSPQDFEMKLLGHQ